MSAVLETLLFFLCSPGFYLEQWCQWRRRQVGGHWERVYVDWPVASTMWLPNAHGARYPLEHPTGVCEDYA